VLPSGVRVARANPAAMAGITQRIPFTTPTLAHRDRKSVHVHRPTIAKHQLNRALDENRTIRDDGHPARRRARRANPV